MFDGHESKEAGHQNRYQCSSPALTASAIAVLQTRQREAVATHRSNACHQGQVSLVLSLCTGSISLLPAWCHQQHLVSPDVLCCFQGGQEQSIGWLRYIVQSTSAMQWFLESHLLGPLMDSGVCVSDALLG